MEYKGAVSYESLKKYPMKEINSLVSALKEVVADRERLINNKGQSDDVKIQH